MDSKLEHPAATSSRQLLRHTVATLAYRANKVTRGAPPNFADYRACDSARAAGQILAHLADLLDWAVSQARGKQDWRDSAPLAWDEGTKRFFTALRVFDEYLASDQQLSCPPEKLFQGAIADSFTHVGQLAMLRRLAGAPIRGENYAQADIVVGRVTAQQTPPRREFD